METTRKSILSKLIAAIMALAICAIFGASVLLTSEHLPESEAAIPSQGALMVGEEVSLGGEASMNLMTVNGAPAYSVSPARENPASGTYALVSPPQPPQQSVLANLRAILFTSYGAPGFDESLYPSTYFDGTPMTVEKYQVATYIMVSNVYGLEWGAPTDGASDEFTVWANTVMTDTLNKIEGVTEWTTPSNFTLVEIQADYPKARVLSFIPGGYIQASISSAASLLTDGNAMYSLSDAVYRIYDNRECAGNPIGILQTDSNGASNSVYLSEGTYYVKQSAAPAGYALSNDVTEVTVANGITNTVTLTVTPLVDSDPLVILKRDANHQASTNKTNVNSPQGGASLADAQYTVAYYQSDSITSVAQAQAATPAWTKILVTSWDGSKATAAPTVTDMYSNGTVSGWPVGTYLVTETKAPRAGYLIDSESPYLFSITSDGTSAESRIVVGTVGGNRMDPISVANPLISQDRVFSGDISIRRTTGTGVNERPVSGVGYDIINNNDYPVINPENGEWVAKGGVVCTIRTSDTGYATTKDLKNNTGNTAPIAFGTYIIKEIPAAGVAAQGDMTTSIMFDGQNRSFSVDESVGAYVQVVKVDKNSNNPISGTTQYRVLDSSKTIMPFPDNYPSSNTSSTLTLDANGKGMIPTKLAAGTYYLQEVTAPYGYQLNTSDIPFTISDAQVASSTYMSPVVVNLEDENAWGTITIKNYDVEHGTSGLITGASATYDVIAAEDIYTEDGTRRVTAGTVVAPSVKTTAGTVTTPNLYLGKYIVKQTKAPEGYLADDTEYPVTISYVDDKTSPVNVTVNQYNKAVKGTVNANKVDADSKKVVPVAGTVFEVKTAEAIVGKDGYEWYPAGQVVDIVVTAEDGYARGTKLLPLGNYEIVERNAPYPYILNTTPTPTSLEYVDDQIPVVEPTNGGAVEDERATTIFRVSKRDKETNKLVTTTDTVIEVRAAEDIVMPEGTMVYSKDALVDTITTDATGYKNGTVEAPVGNYYLVEKSAPYGYVLDSESKFPVSFVYPGQTSTDNVTEGYVSDIAAKGTISFSKVDADGGTTVQVAGIKAKVYAAEDIVTGDGTVRVKAGEEACPELVTDSTGTAASAPLYLGSYRLVETEAPKGYLLNDTPIAFTLSYENQNVPIVTANETISDHNAMGIIEITKVDAETGNTIPEAGATFEIYAKTDIVTPDGTIRLHAGEKACEPIATDSTGKATTPQLFLGIYTIHETKAPTGYAISATDQDAVLAYENQTTPVVTASEKFANTVQKGVIKVEKKASDTDKTVRVAGAKFEVYADENIVIPDGSTKATAGELVDTITTDETGFASTKALYIGKYSVKEIKAPNGYLLNETATDSVSMEYGDQSVAVLPFEASISDNNVMGIISLNVLDSREKNQLAGTKWDIVAAEDIVTGDGTVRAKKGDVVDSLTTAESGKVTSKELYLGKYELVETHQLDEYKRNLAPTTVTIAAENDTDAVVNEDITITNKPTDMSVTKTGSDGAFLTDTRFVAWLDDDATDFRGAAVFTSYDITATEITQISDFNNMSAEFEKTTALSSDKELSKAYNVYSAPGELPQGTYKLHVEYKDDGKEYGLDETFTVNENDNGNAIFFIGKLGTGDASNSFRSIAAGTPASPANDSAVSGQVEVTSVSDAEKTLEQFYKVSDEIEEAYKANKDYVLEKLNAQDIYGSNVESALTNLGELVRKETTTAIEKCYGFYNVIVITQIGSHDDPPTTSDSGVGPSEKNILIPELEQQIADILKDKNIDISNTVTNEEYDIAVSTMAIQYVNTNTDKFNIDKSADDIRNIREAVLEAVGDDASAGDVATFNAALAKAQNGDIKAVMPLYNDEYNIAEGNIINAIFDKDEELSERLRERLDTDLPRDAFIIYAINNPVANADRSELLTAPSGICNRVPVVLTDGIFVSSAADNAGVLEFLYIPQGSFSIAESLAVSGYANDRRISNFKVGENGHISSESTLAPSAVMDDDGNVTFTNKAITLSVSKRAAETGTELPGNTLAVYAIDGKGEEKLVDQWVSAEEPHKITTIAAGNYVLKEEEAAEGYSIAAPISFRVLDSAEDQSIAMENSVFGMDNFFENMGQLGDAVPFAMLGVMIAGACGVIAGVRRRHKE